MSRDNIAMESDCCPSCHMVLHDPYVECNECEEELHICLECFSKGKEFGRHSNSHAYKIIKKDFALLEEDWTAEEESLLLSSLLQRGHGNWEDIAKVVVNKTPLQCEQHFEKVYIENSTGLVRDDWRRNPEHHRRDQPVNYLSPVDFPPRCVNNTALHRDLGGYNAARGDFDFEPDSLAEFDVTSLKYDTVKSAMNALEAAPGGISEIIAGFGDDKPDTELEAHLQLAAVDVYSNKLKRRGRTKGIIKELGLLNKSRTLGQKEEIAAMGPSYSQLLKCARLMCSFDFDYIMESCKHEQNLKQSIYRLQEYRVNGLKKAVSTALFAKLRLQREKNLREISSDTVRDWMGSCRVTFIQDKASGKLIPTTRGRKSTLPLDIVGMPGYERLSQEERGLCAEIRIRPEMFFDFKKTLVEECERMQGLRLADARPVVKIDVNKTKRLYEHFMKCGDIYKPKK